MLARCPASSANLGPGFDALALALDLSVEVSVEPAERLHVTSEGEGADLPCDATHLAAVVACRVAGTDRLRIHVRSAIPVSRGLGSSAALAVAAAAAAGAGVEGALAEATIVDGHPENAAASVLGGLVAATMVGERPVAERLPLDSGLGFVVLVPDRQLATKAARSALPAMVPHGDAAFNLSRMGILIAGLADRTRLIAEAAQDRLHQPPRSALFPEAPALLAALVDAGALASCWSGAGPCLLAFCHLEDAAALRVVGEQLLARQGVPGIAIQLRADHLGLQITP